MISMVYFGLAVAGLVQRMVPAEVGVKSDLYPLVVV